MSESRPIAERAADTGGALVKRLLDIGVDGHKAWPGAISAAGLPPSNVYERERQIDRLIASHRRMAAAGGFLTGFGGFLAMPVAVPADLAQFYVLSTRMAGGVAHLRGYDVQSDEVRSMILVTLLGAQGAAVLSEAGVQIGTKAAAAALKRLPGKALVKINQAVGFRLVTKFGEKGVLNLGKAVPLVGAGIGAGVNALGITAVAKYAKSTFPADDDVRTVAPPIPVQDDRGHLSDKVD